MTYVTPERLLIQRNLKNLIGCEIVTKDNKHFYISSIESNYDVMLKNVTLVDENHFLKDYEWINSMDIMMYKNEDTLIPLIDFIKLIEETNDE